MNKTYYSLLKNLRTPDFFDKTWRVVIRMSNLIYLKDFVKEKHRNQVILPFCNLIKGTYKHWVEGDDMCLYITNEDSLFIFLEFVPKGTTTTLQTMKELFYDEGAKERESSGEWLVKDVYYWNKQKSDHTIAILERDHLTTPIHYLKSIMEGK